ncbi:uncharacterized protein LOC117115728 isoform X3 [Anneissia japonica]|uniref:uncharacterized protein LOC117115728 isoform X2 n=1 Tax=Anneissia japonica TaxID=1529436 RepID=UPI0014258DF7|nr:uncharacterized protein LOC117115728 isoform X2 [Anneissia japonica]XP_033115543.1 uncharacterized protein LOC117115728 isoform X3 [Anneissia japonica]
MSYCSLSGIIVNEMMEECDRMNIVLEDNMLRLKGNDLSNIDGKTLAELIRVIIQPYDYDDDDYDDDNYYLFRWSDYSLSADNLQRLVESGVNMRPRLNWKSIDLSTINLSSVSGRTLACLFKISPDLSHIDMSYCSLSGIIVNEMMKECGRMNIVLKDNMLGLKGNDLSDIDGKSLVELVRVIHLPYDKHCGAIEPFRWRDYSLSADNLQRLVESGVNMRLNRKWIDLSKINLSSVSGRTLACLIKISPDTSHIDMSYCSLSGIIVNEMMEECGRMNIVLEDNMLRLKGNDLSDIDGKSLVELVRVNHPPYKHFGAFNPFRWSDYSLSADNLQRLVESGVNMRLRLNWKRIDLSKINLSSVSGRTLACLIKISPDTSHIDMSYCSLSGIIVNEMMEECDRMNIVLEDNMLVLKGNDLSDIDGKSLVELVRVIHHPPYKHYSAIEPFRWSDYSLSADNLQRLVESCKYETAELEKHRFE